MQLAAIIILVYLTLLPILFLFYGAFVPDIGSFQFTFANIVKVYTDSSLLPLAGRTFIFATSSSLVALIMGGTAAWITEKTATRLRGPVSAINLLSLTFPSLLTSIVWISLLAPKSGLINSWLTSTFGLPVGVFQIYSLPGMIWVEGLHGAPLAYLLMVPVLGSMDRSFEEASAMSGASLGQTIRKITLPIMVPAIISILVLRFVRSIESFETPVLIGLPRGIDVLISKIYNIVSADRNYGAANAYSLGIMLVAFIGIYFYQRVTSKAYRFASVTGKGFKAEKAKIGRFQILADSYLVFYFVVLGVLPLATILWNAFLPYPMRPSMEALSLFTLKNFQFVLGSPKVALAFKNSLIVGAGASVACVLLATVVAWIVLRTKMRGRWLLDLLTFLPMTIPSFILGVGLIWIYLTVPIPIYGTLWILLIGYTTSFLPMAMRFISPALSQIHKELEESAHISGATWWMTFRRILMPLIFPAALGAGTYIFMLVFRVLSSAIVIYTPKTIVVPVLIFEMFGEASGNSVHALLLMTTLLLVPFALSYHYLTRKYGLRTKGEG